MEIHVYDTYVQAKDGHTMHFDVITGVQDHDKAIEYAKQYHDLETSVGTPILVITSSCFILFHSVGFHVIPWVLLGELCPVKLKSLTSGIVISMVAILGFAVVKIFPIALGK